MISVEEALERILDEITALNVTQVALPEALGLIAKKGTVSSSR